MSVTLDTFYNKISESVNNVYYGLTNDEKSILLDKNNTEKLYEVVLTSVRDIQKSILTNLGIKLLGRVRVVATYLSDCLNNIQRGNDLVQLNVSKDNHVSSKIFFQQGDNNTQYNFITEDNSSNDHVSRRKFFQQGHNNQQFFF